MKKSLFLILLLVHTSFCFSQNSMIDSLQNILRTSNIDSTKAKACNNLFLMYEFEDEVKAADYLDQAFKFSRKASFLKGEATAYMYSGYFAEDKGNYPEALKHYSASLALWKKVNNKTGIANNCNNIGNVHYNQGNYPEALTNYFAALKVRETLNNKGDIAGSYANIGLVYLHQSNYKEALKNYSKSLSLYEAADDKEGISMSHNNIGLVCYYLGNYKEALTHYAEALKIFEEIDNKRGISESYNYIGGVHAMQGNYKEALENYFASLKINQSMNNKKSIATAYGNIGIVYTKQRKFDEAKSYLSKARAMLEEIGAKANLKITYSALTILDSTKGDFKGAYENHKLFIRYRDSLDNEQTRKQTIQSQMTFDFEKKEAVAKAEHQKELENQQLLAEEKSRKQKAVIGLVGICLLVVMVFAGFVVRSLRVTRKQKLVIESQKNLVEKQKLEVEQQKHFVEEHQKEIIDSITYAKRLQQAILPSNEEIKKHLPDSFILYKPKDIVAGDFYWLEYKKDIVFIAAADSTGHGVPGAMVSVVCSNALNRAVNEFNLADPGKILDKTRELVLETFAKSGEEIKDGMDISLLAINRSENNVQWSGANNQLWYIFPVDPIEGETVSVSEIKADKQSIGKTDDPKLFKTHTIELKPGTLFYLMTDGYADQFGGKKGKKFKYRQLQEVLAANCRTSTSEQKEKLDISFDRWKADLEQVDDVTIIGIRI